MRQDPQHHDRETLAEAIARCPDIWARPDLILRLVDLWFLLAPPDDTPPS